MAICNQLMQGLSRSKAGWDPVGPPRRFHAVSVAGSQQDGTRLCCIWCLFGLIRDCSALAFHWPIQGAAGIGPVETSTGNRPLLCYATPGAEEGERLAAVL